MTYPRLTFIQPSYIRAPITSGHIRFRSVPVPINSGSSQYRFRSFNIEVHLISKSWCDELSMVYVIFCGSISSQKHVFSWYLICAVPTFHTHTSQLGIYMHVRRTLNFNFSTGAISIVQIIYNYVCVWSHTHGHIVSSGSDHFRLRSFPVTISSYGFCQE